MWKPLLIVALVGSAAPAWADIYKCTGPDGRVTYTNQKSPGKSCEIIAQDKPVSTVPPPAARPRQASPADFPRVDGGEQKARDNERRAILERELASEQRNLDAAKRELAEQETLVLPEERIVGGGINAGKREARLQSYRERIQLHERNLESIRRELANLK